MMMEVRGGYLYIEKRPGDRFRRSGWGGTPETQLLSQIRKALIGLGCHKVIQKRMSKDGHLVADEQSYVRFKTYKTAPWRCVYNDRYAINDAGSDLMENGYTTLRFENL